jgi:hypothetical protein
MKFRKINGEVYVEWSTKTAAFKEFLKLAATATVGLVMFYTLWILLEFIK